MARAKSANAEVLHISTRHIVASTLPNGPKGDWKMQPTVKPWNVDAAKLPDSKMLKFGHMDQLNRSMAAKHTQKFGPVVHNCDDGWRPLVVEPIDIQAQR